MGRPKGVTNEQIRERRAREYTPTPVMDIETQADRVVDKFGGPYELSEILTQAGTPRSPSAIYRWSYPKERGGCGGVIPSETINVIFSIARLHGVLLTLEDLDPRPRKVPPKRCHWSIMRNRKTVRMSVEDKEGKPER